MYDIVEVPLDAAELSEQMGTKYKFWYSDEHRGQSLFKEGRPQTGENWAEVVAARLATAIALPHATYELARCGARLGVVSPTIVPTDGRLIHGNEVLSSVNADYGAGDVAWYRQRAHTLARVVGYFKIVDELINPPMGFETTGQIKSALDVFVGYLMFDAWIANQDRHDENWALIRDGNGKSFLAPSYDHGSSMGRNETDERRKQRLTTKDAGLHISAYVCRARSAFYPLGASAKTKPLLTLDAFAGGAKIVNLAAQEWRERLADCSVAQIDEIIEPLPDDIASPTTKEFTKELLRLNRQSILNLKW